MSQSSPITSTAISINERAAALVERMKAEALELRIGIARGELGETLIDAGAEHAGGIAAGLRMAEICMGGLGVVSLIPNATVPRWPWSVAVRSSDPVIACLASQYAGWRLSDGEGRDAFMALGSGPARALARGEPLFENPAFAHLAYADSTTSATLVLESARPPPATLVAKVARECGVSPERLTILYAPTQSLAGSVQIAARVLEVGLHKAHELKFPLERILDGMGTAPLPPPHPDFIAAMGRTNDAIIYAGQIHLFVSGPVEDARALADQLPSQRSRDYGRPFAEVFRHFKGDFYAIDPMLFSPAQVTITALETGETVHRGQINPSLLDASFA
jgi:methenyltetrahydromethanopterin cyclohydrolase